MTDRPLVSIIIPCLDAEGKIARAVQSCLAQSHAALEVVISPDDGRDYLGLLRDQGLVDDRVRQVPGAHLRSGPSAARNRALAMARGAFVAPLDADDAYAPDHLARLLPLAAEHGVAVANLRAHLPGGRCVCPFAPGEGARMLDLRGLILCDFPLFFLAAREHMGTGWNEAVDFSDDVVINIELWLRCGQLPLSLTPSYEYFVSGQSLSSGPEAGARAERGYAQIIDHFANWSADAHDPRGTEVVALLEAKRARNRDFERARAAGEVRTFYEFANSFPAGSQGS